MPQPKGHEPFSRYWSVHWGVQSSDVSKLQLYCPRIQIFESEAAADAKVAVLKGIAGFGQFKVGSGTIYKTGPIVFFNKKAFVVQLVSGLAESVQMQI